MTTTANGAYESEERAGIKNESEQRAKSVRGAVPWRIWTAEELYAPVPPIDWLITGILPKGSVALLVAYGASLKSWLALDLVDSVGAGRQWLGRFDVRKGTALLIDYEAGQYEVRRRLQAIARGRDHVGPVEGVECVTMPPTFLADPAFARIVEELARTRTIIIIDTLAAGSPGADENDARFAAPLNTLKAIAERTGCTFLVLHHTRKQREGEDERETTRGTSAIFNALDAELKIFRSGEDFLVKMTKARNAKAAEPFGVRVRDVAEDAVRVDAFDLKAAEKEVQAAGTTAQRAKVATDAALVALLLAEQPGIVLRDVEHTMRARAGSWSWSRGKTAVAKLGSAVVERRERVRGGDAVHLFIDGSQVADDVLRHLEPHQRATVASARPAES